LIGGHPQSIHLLDHDFVDRPCSSRLAGITPGTAKVRLKSSQIRAFLPADGYSIRPLPGSGWLCAHHPVAALDVHVPLMLFHP
jgi:hypothetical protein